VLPSLFGPALAAFVAHAAGWRWVFVGSVGLAVGAALLVAPSLRRLPTPEPGDPAPPSRLAWAAVGGAAVLAVELVGSARGPLALLAALALAVVGVALRRLLPAHTLLAGRGLPAVIGTRGLLSAAFFAAEAYVVFVLQDHWHWSPGEAGIALTCVGVVWAAASQLQSRLGDRIRHVTAMRCGAGLVLVGTVGLAVAVATQVHPALAVAAYVVAGFGMGLGYPRTGVAMLEASGDRDRGFNSSALSVADSLGGALALSAAGIVFGLADRAGGDPFLAVYVLAAAVGVLAVLVAGRTGVRPVPR
jgi:MFS family permease